MQMTDINGSDTVSNATIASEQQVIGGLICSPENIRKYAAVLKPGYFSYEIYRELYEILVSAKKANKPIDAAFIHHECKTTEQQKQAVICLEAFISEAMLPEHVKAVISSAKERRIKQSINDIFTTGNYTVEALQGIVDREKNDFGLEESACERSIDSFIKSLNQPKNTIKTGFTELDYTLGGGIRRGTLTVIGARPSTGKTTFAINIARNQVKGKKRVYFYSLEMTADMIYERYCADVCFIDSRAFNANKLSERDVEKVKNLMTSIKNGKHLFVFDNKHAVENITADIYANKPDVAIIDYVQRIRSTDERRFNDERIKINYITSELKIAAKQTGTCIIVLSQVTRAGKDAPTMSDLKESGALEEDGDYIMLLYRPFLTNRESGEYKPQETELTLDKNKFGATKEIDFEFDLKHQRFTEIKKADDYVRPVNKQANDDLPI